MAVTAVAEEVNEHVALKGVTEVQRQTGNESNGFRVIRVYVEDWRLNHFTDVGAVRVERASSGLEVVKPTVVDYDANGTAHFITTRFRHVQGFLNHALPCDCRITVNGDWQHFIAARLVQTIQTRTHGTDNHRADDFRCDGLNASAVNLTALGFDIRREAHVVLHVTGAEVLFMFTRKFVEQILRFYPAR